MHSHKNIFDLIPWLQTYNRVRWIFTSIQLKKSLLITAVFIFCFVFVGCYIDKETRYQQLYEKGKECFERKEYTEALYVWGKALEIKKTEITLYHYIGEAYLKIADPFTAMKIFKQAVHIDPTAWAVWEELAKLQLISGDYAGCRRSLEKIEGALPKNIDVNILRGDFEIAQNNFEAAKSAYLHALVLSPESQIALLKLSICSLSMGDAEKAQKYYSHVNYDSNKSNILLLIGNYWDFQKNHQKAEFFYKKASDNDPEDIGLLYNISEFYIKWDQYKKAEDFLLKALNKMPENYMVKEALLECFMKQQKTQDARNLMNEITETENQSPEINFLRGKFHLFAGEPVASANFFKMIIDKTPDLPVIQYLLGVSYMASGQNHLARQAFIKALMLDPEFIDADLALSGICYKNGEYDLSLEYAKRVNERDTDNFNAYMIVGNIFLDQSDFDKATENFLRARFLNPDAPEPIYYLAMTAEFSSKTDDAVYLYDELLSKNPNLVDATQRYVSLLMKSGKSDKAITFLENNIAKVSENGYLYCILGNCYLEANRVDEAIKSFQKTISIMPELPNAYVQLSKIYEKLGYESEEISILEKCIQNTFDYPDAYSELSRVYQKVDKKDKAIEILETGVARNPDAFILANNLAWMYLENDGDLNKAFYLVQNAYEFSSDDPIIADTLAWAYYKKGIYSMAEILLEESIKLKDDYPIVHYHLGMVLKAREKKEEAQQAFNRAISLGLEEPYLTEAKSVMSNE